MLAHTRDGDSAGPLNLPGLDVQRALMAFSHMALPAAKKEEPREAKVHINVGVEIGKLSLCKLVLKLEDFRRHSFGRRFEKSPIGTELGHCLVQYDYLFSLLPLLRTRARAPVHPGRMPSDRLARSRPTRPAMPIFPG